VHLLPRVSAEQSNNGLSPRGNGHQAARNESTVRRNCGVQCYTNITLRIVQSRWCNGKKFRYFCVTFSGNPARLSFRAYFWLNIIKTIVQTYGQWFHRLLGNSYFMVFHQCFSLSFITFWLHHCRLSLNTRPRAGQKWCSNLQLLCKVFIMTALSFRWL